MREVQKQFVIMSTSSSAYSKYKIVVKVKVDKTKEYFYERKSGHNAVDEPQDYLYQGLRVTCCMRGFLVLGGAW